MYSSGNINLQHYIFRYISRTKMETQNQGHRKTKGSYVSKLKTSIRCLSPNIITF